MINRQININPVRFPLAQAITAFFALGVAGLSNAAIAALPTKEPIIAMRDVDAAANTRAVFLDPATQCKLYGRVQAGSKPDTFVIILSSKVCGNMETKISAAAVPASPPKMTSGPLGPVLLRTGEGAFLEEKQGNN